MVIQNMGIKASNKSDAKTKVSLCLALSGFYRSEYKFGEVKRENKTEYEVEVIFKGDKGLF